MTLEDGMISASAPDHRDGCRIGNGLFNGYNSIVPSLKKATTRRLRSDIERVTSIKLYNRNNGEV